MEENDLKKIFGIENRTKYFFHVLIFLAIAFVVIFSLLVIGEQSLNEEKIAIAQKISNPFEKITLEAKSAVVWDIINNRELFTKNADLPLPLASLTKVMTALVADSILGNFSDVKITNEDLGPEGDSKLSVGDIWQSGDLRDFTLITSSNDGALALAVAAKTQMQGTASSDSQFIKTMNNMALKIGLSNSRFFNEHGLDREVDRGGAYGSARDMVFLFAYALKNRPQVLEATRYKNLQITSAEHKYDAENTNTSLDQVPNILASKTGYTDLAGGNLVIAYDAGLNRPIIVAVLGSSEQGRFSDVLMLVEATLAEIQSTK